MATLAATAKPKLSEMSEGAKAEKSRNELDKLIKQAGQFYQDTADIEGRGRFPGQDKYDDPVGGTVASGGSYSSTSHESEILKDILGVMTYGDQAALVLPLHHMMVLTVKIGFQYLENQMKIFLLQMQTILQR